MRDTDADWRAIGAEFPYWGVLTAPEYRQAQLDPAALESFYATGREHMDDVARRYARMAGAPLKVGSALDFGCGVGRLAEAMTPYADQVFGVDVSPGMLVQARANTKGGVLYGEALPDGPVDWINSFIVFQHIPPERGLALLEDLLARLAPGGFVSLHVTATRDSRHGPAYQPPAVPGGRLGWLYRLFDRSPPPPPPGLMLMHDYDLGQVLGVLHRAGVGETWLVPTDHGGHYGEMIFGRRGA